jgi:ADP-ribose pyrophosphatase YjhB (NUDIX family)
MDECREHTLIADVALLAEGKVLLVRYRKINRYDHQPGWFLPDDGLARLEHPEDAARRIAREQAGLEIPAAPLDHVESFSGNDGSWHIAFHHRADLERIPATRPSGDLEAAEWFPLDALPERREVAHHGWAIDVLAKILSPNG